MDQHALPLLEVGEVAERLLHGHEDHGHGAGLLKRPGRRFGRNQGCRPRVVCAEATRGLAEDVLGHAQRVHAVAELEHCAGGVRAGGAGVAGVEAHDVQHVPEVQAHGADAELHEARHYRPALVLRHGPKVRQSAPRSHVQPHRPAELQVAARQPCVAEGARAERNLLLTSCGQGWQGLGEGSPHAASGRGVEVKGPDLQCARVLHADRPGKTPEPRVRDGARAPHLLLVGGERLGAPGHEPQRRRLGRVLRSCLHDPQCCVQDVHVAGFRQPVRQDDRCPALLLQKGLHGGVVREVQLLARAVGDTAAALVAAKVESLEGRGLPQDEPLLRGGLRDGRRRRRLQAPPLHAVESLLL
mmetsp:Transcript_73389/g.231779  ORF Transcript_73389/g.231779 Transcript_73389/m.231779 type:complete len:357 (+) Transcript_73389:2871-3941(+)